ncbi:hypothetical protein [Paenibacillus wenxiniae]|uniref:PqqD family protein n=1 Tax=Paenibacillus wenxiniae TaxID=1636843 RepID=A0ABW4RQH2_9BACL
MAKGLCTTLAASYSTESTIAPLSSTPDNTSFEALFDLIAEQEDDTDPVICYKNEYWNIDPHGEHCLFISSSGISMEVHIYNYRWIDAAFFSQFLQSLAHATGHPHSRLAQQLTASIAPADFQSICALLEYLCAQGMVIQHNAVHFSLA